MCTHWECPHECASAPSDPMRRGGSWEIKRAPDCALLASLHLGAQVSPHLAHIFSILFLVFLFSLG